MKTGSIATPEENQFGCLIPEGSELIFPAPLRDGVNRENQFVNR